MAPISSDQTLAAIEAGIPQTSGVRRKAFYLESQGQPLFAWLHASSNGPSVDHGVIICAPLGHEQLHAHRGLRHLADSLARANIPVLRFDWHGTGDSAGSDGDPQRVETWKANLRDAIRWMRRQLGCQRISLIGLRIGATLAAAAIEDEEIDNVIFWSPILKGRAYVREMTAIDLTAESRPIPVYAAQGDIEAAGFLVSQETANDLSQLSILQTELKCQRVLIVDRGDVPKDHRLFDRCIRLGIPVEQIQSPGLPEMLAEPHRGAVPQRTIQEITTWLATRIAATETEFSKVAELQDDSNLRPGEYSLVNELWVLGAGEAHMRHRSEATASQEPGDAIREVALHISATPDLFGILSEPETVSSDLPIIVLLNAGSAYRAGPGRLHVHLARQLAAQGFRCLRLDLGGLGDSVTDNFANENDTYAETVFRDIDLTLKHLRTKLGASRCILMGLCSGAYAAFQSAAQFSDPMLIESVLINPLTFFWKKGMSLESNPVQTLVKQNYYLNAARKPEKWLKLLSGRSQTGLLAAGKLLVNLLSQPRSEAKSAMVADPELEAHPLGHPRQDNLPADLLRVADEGRTLAMFFSKSDPGYRILTYRAGKQARMLEKSQQLRLSFISDADHTFSRRTARQDLIERVVSDMRSRHGRADETPSS